MPGDPQSTRASVLTTETLSFSIAASIVTTLLQLANIQWAGAPTDFWWALGTSGFVGFFILAYQWPEPPADKTERIASDRGFLGEWWWERGVRTAFGGLGVGLLNILLVTAAVLGVGSAVEGEAVVADVPALTSQ